MTGRLIGWLLLLTVSASALPWEFAAAQSLGGPETAAEAPSESRRGPEPAPTSGPCGAQCLCVCCPAPLVATPTLDAVSSIVLSEGEGVRPQTPDLPKDDLVDSLFHPPRLG